MSNRIQILCNQRNKNIVGHISDTWMMIERETEYLEYLKENRNFLITSILDLKQRNLICSDYIFISLSNIPLAILYTQNLIASYYDNLKELHKKLTVC